MVKTNEYININPKPSEIIYKLKEFEYQTPSFEEFMNDYQIDKKIADSYEEEFRNYDKKSYGPCFYSPSIVNSHKVAGKHINECRSLDCSYYRRIVGNRVNGTVGITASLGIAGAWFGACLAAPVTGGTSLLVAASVAVGSTTTAIGLGGTVWTVSNLTETRRGVENELKLKWEKEQNERKIRDLNNELNKAKKALNEALTKKDNYKNKWLNSIQNSDHWQTKYKEEKEKVEELESQVRKLKRELGLK